MYFTSSKIKTEFRLLEFTNTQITLIGELGYNIVYLDDLLVLSKDIFEPPKENKSGPDKTHEGES